MLGLACGDDGGSTASVSATADKDPISISSAGDGSQGALQVLVNAGSGVSGLDPGTGVGELADGWTVRYDRFLATAGQFSAYSAADGRSITSSDVYVVDMLRSFSPGAVLFRLDAVDVGDYDEFRLSMPAGPTAMTWNGTAADRDFMRAGGYSLYIEGTMTRAPAGQLCAPGGPTDCTRARTITFKWGFPVGTDFIGCAGFGVDDSGVTDVDWTIPGDRWFFTGFSRDAEELPRRAQWIADADLDRDGETTLVELSAIEATALFTPELGYDLGGAPIQVHTALDFLVAQVHTMGLDRANGCSTALPTP